MFFKTPENIDFAGYADDNTACTYTPQSPIPPPPKKENIACTN